MNVLLPQWVTTGAPGASASSTSNTAGSSSRSRRTRATASSAASSVSARIATIGSPLNRTRSYGEHELLLGLDADEAEDRVDVVRHVLAVSARTKPGTRSASDRSMPPDPRVVERAADHLEVEHPGERAVGGELASGRSRGRSPSLRWTDWPTTLQRLHRASGVAARLGRRRRARPRRSRSPRRSAGSRCSGRCCPDSASAISSAVGAGLWSSSALATMTMPGVQ